MTPKRLAFALSGLVILMLVAILGGAYEINSILGKQSVNLVALKAKSASLDQEQLSLNNTKKEIEKYSDLEQIAQTVVPQDKNLAETLREIDGLAIDNNVTLTSVTFPPSTLGTSSASSSAAASTSAAPTAPKVDLNSKTNTLSQLLPVKSIPGVYVLSITISSGSKNPVKYEDLLNFIEALEKNRRTSQITSVSLTPDPQNPDYLSFTLVLQEYVKP